MKKTNEKYINRILSALFLISLLIFSLTGCRQHFDRSGYIQGMLDATYKGDCEKYARTLNTTEASLEKEHEDFIDREAQVWLQFCGINSEKDIPEDLKEEVVALINDLYLQADYQVAEADRDGFVTLTVSPMDIYNDVYSDFVNFNTSFKERNNNYEFTDYSDDDFLRAYLEPLIDIFRKHMESLSYNDPVTVTVQVIPDASGRYSITDEEVTAIYSAIINYTINIP